jgi:hypothetical protein
MTGFCAKAVLENIVTSANKPNANNFFIAFSLSRDPDFGSCCQELLLVLSSDLRTR